MALRLFNSLTRQKEEFHPLDANNVRMYVCGPTVYDYAHIGNARPAIVFDVLYRLLKHLYPGKGTAADGSRVTYVRNITDVDDKINARARQEYPDLPLNEAVAEVTERTTKQYHADIAALGCLPPTIEPTCTSHIPDMVKMIEELIAHGCAYVADGHVLFEVAKAKDYGALSRRSLDEMMAGARVEVAPYKKNPMDFVLWKPSDAETPGWPSPWGRGRPGWHIECSAMSAKHLGKVFDIHGGGIDLQFPHHENELAQTRCAFGTDVMANVWMHNGFLQVEGQKMSKSLGNFVTINEVLHQRPGEVARLAMLMTHYREPINWTHDQLEQARSELAHWTSDNQFAVEAAHVEIDRRKGKSLEALPDAFLAALLDDLNTPAAITAIRSHATASSGKPSELRQIYSMANLLGLLRADRLGVHTGTVFGGALKREVVELNRPLRAAVANGLKEEETRLVRQIESCGSKVTIHPDGWVSIDSVDQVRNRAVEHLITARSAARAAKNWAEADCIRDELSAMGIQLMDSKDPKTGEVVTTWEVKR